MSASLPSGQVAPPTPEWMQRSDPWTDLGLTLPILLGYHLGVVFLPMRNAADFVTSFLVRLADNSMVSYAAIALGACSICVGVLLMAGRGHKLAWHRFLLVAVEGVAYAILMRIAANYVVGSLRLAGADSPGPFAGVVMSLGAGFYEELAFRVVAYGLAGKFITSVVGRQKTLVLMVWALATSALFSGWHYVGPFGDPFQLGSFVFRWICGLVFVVVYQFRGFAPAVWCHALYDVWVMAL